MEWIENEPFRSAKVIIAKSEHIIGEHYHLKKKEVFLLLTGEAKEVVVGETIWKNIKAPFKWIVDKGFYHSFKLKKGSILLGIASKKFDPNDEICMKES